MTMAIYHFRGAYAQHMLSISSMLQVELMTNLQEMSLYGYVRTGDAQEPDLSALKELTVSSLFLTCPSYHGRNLISS